MSKGMIGILIAAICLGTLIWLRSPAFAWVMAGLMLFVMYEILELYKHFNYHITVLHDRIRRLEQDRLVRDVDKDQKAGDGRGKGNEQSGRRRGSE